MAKFVMCAVYDAAVKAFSPPFCVRSVDEARRSFGDAVADPKMEFGKHPMDYVLFHLADWDDAGDLRPLSTPNALMKALDVVQPS